MLQILFILIVVAPVIASLYVIFEQQGRKGWEAIVPVWNLWILIQITNKSWWWMLYLCIPFINIFVLLLLLIELSVGYKRNAIWEYFSAAVLPFLYFPYLIWAKKEVFAQPKTLPVFKKSIARDWFDTIIFAVLAAAIVRMFFFENYTIPTSSMEKSMLIGDYVYVSKMAYGARLPQTPIAFPLVHHTMPLTKNTKSYMDAVQLNYKRFFQRKTVQRGDAVVFNFPVGDTVATQFQSSADYYSLCREYGRDRVLSDRLNFGEIVVRPVDKRENFVKRCVGVAGDTLQIINQEIYINGQLEEFPQNSQFNYQILPNPLVISKTQWRELGISNEDINMLYSYAVVPLTEET
ncbi:MAG: S26 family signal peptidase, partial [Bacteroidales bacterium]|nr:S26 family signal peptidase [Bacteroidales bacterium]